MLLAAIGTIAAPFAGAILALLVPARASARIALLPPAATIALGAVLWTSAPPAGTALLRLPWVPSLGIAADLRVDRFGAFFVLLVGAVGLGVVQHSRRYLGAKATRGYWASLLAFTGAMLGIVLSDSLVLLYVFWELTTIASALLIAGDGEERAAVRGAVQAFLVTAVGGLAMLAGIVLLGELAGTTSLAELAARGPAIARTRGSTLPLALLAAGAFAKSAQAPFHFWLEGAMAAPAPVSAYLHSATMVKAGVFLLGRLHPIFAEAPIWLPLLAAVGLTTFVVSGWSAVRATDLKLMLAQSTAAYLGFITAFYGFAAPGSGAAGQLVVIANHASYKSALFLLLGWLEKRTGTRDLRVLVRERWVEREGAACALFAIGAAAMAGAPLVLGFAAKEVFWEGLLRALPGAPGAVATSAAGAVAVIAAVAASAFAVAYALKLVVDPFGGREAPPDGRGTPRSALSPWLLAIPAVLLAPQVAGGLAPRAVVGALEPALEWPGGPAVWYHAGAVLFAGAGSIALGCLVYAGWRQRATAPASRRLAERAASLVATATLRLAEWTGTKSQAGGHPRFVAVTIGATLLAAMAAAIALGGEPPLGPIRSFGPDLHLGAIVASAVAGAGLSIVMVQSRVTKVLLLAVVGYGIAVVYVLFRAPDLALTQLLVETVSLLLFLLVFRGFPPRLRDDRARSERLAHAAVACATGLVLGGLAWTAGMKPAQDAAGYRQASMAAPAAKGRNAVNVILVDVRAADTLGEITVLAIAALGVVALLGVPTRRRERQGGRVR